MQVKGIEEGKFTARQVSLRRALSGVRELCGKVLRDLSQTYLAGSGYCLMQFRKLPKHLRTLLEALEV